jgi:phosphohistidine phosphatase
MLIYFLRHADAIYTGDRPLSEKGHKQMAGVAKALKRLEVQVDALYTSPLLRARQTADAVAEVLGMKPQVTDLLDSGTTLRRLRELLEGCGAEARVMVVGHEPDFSEMVGGLIGGGEVDMKKAGLALVECDEVAPGAGLLRWLLPPKAM